MYMFIIKTAAIFFAIIFVVLGLLYIGLFHSNGRKRKKLPVDMDFEPTRAKDYPPPFPNGWFNLCCSDDIKKGQVLEVNAFGKKLAVFRGEDGKVGAMDVFCPHLGANLADGRVIGNRLVCPFHAWEFNKDGECLNIPYSIKGNQNANTRANAWIVKENWGMVLVWYHSNNKPPNWDTEGYLEELKKYNYHGKSSEILRIHLQDFSENGADYAHFDVVHNLLTIPFANKFFHVKHTTNIEFGEENEKHMARFTDFAEIARNKDNSIIKDAGGKAVVTYFGPGFLVFNFQTKFGSPIILKTFTPIGELKVRMEDHVYAPKKSFKLAIKYIVGEATAQFYDDINIWERKIFRQQPNLVKGDGPIMKMRKWYSQFYTEQSVTSSLFSENNTDAKDAVQTTDIV